MASFNEYGEIISESQHVPSYWKGLLLNLLFGFGLFYVNQTLNRKWFYPTIIIGGPIIIFGIIIIYRSPSDSFLFTTSGKAVAVLFFAIIGSYLFSFIDVVWSCYQQRKPSPTNLRFNEYGEIAINMPHWYPSYWKALFLNLFFGLGLFYIDRNISRKWFYPSTIIVCPILVIWIVNNYRAPDKFLFTTAETFVGLVILATCGSYLFSFVDVIWSCYRRRQN